MITLIDLIFKGDLSQINFNFLDTVISQSEYVNFIFPENISATTFDDIIKVFKHSHYADLTISIRCLTLNNLNIRNVFTVNSIHYDGMRKLETFNIFNVPNLINASKVLIVDDIVDSGETMVEVFKILQEKYPMCEFKLASLFYKKTAQIQPDFTVKEAPTWIDFFWEADLKRIRAV